jgi:hypothetical protein
MHSRRGLFTLAITLLTLHVALLMPLLALAQNSPYQQGQTQQTTPVIQSVGEGNQYYLGQANELLMRVNVWGRVLKPGQYFVPATTDLITLISAAGGPIPKSRLTDIQLVRGTADGTNEVIQVNLKRYLKTGDKRLIPSLKPEDTVIVSGSTWQLFADVMQVVGNLALVANVYYLFVIRR